MSINSFTIVSEHLDAEDFALLQLALDMLDQQASDELAKIAANSAEAVPLIYRRSRLLLMRPKLHAMQSGGHTNTMSQIAEARASALSLRTSAKACGPEQGALKFRLTRAAYALDAMALLAIRGIERIEELEQELAQQRAEVAS